LDLAARIYYRLEVEGLARAPRGPALIVINHNSGISFAELIGFGARWYLERGFDDVVVGLAHDGMMHVPGLNNFLLHAGGVRATPGNADKVLRAGRKVLVAPGGNVEAFRPWHQRDRIVFSGRKGFLKLALRNRVPILPTVFHGGHDAFMVLDDGQRIVRALGLKRWLRMETFPIFLGLPWGLAVGPLFHLPLPLKCKVRMLDPIPVDHYPKGSENDPAVLEELYQLVTGRMQQTLTDLATGR
jgi:1-acyl-sn-glycerol-3-phosphate acyltransferase